MKHGSVFPKKVFYPVGFIPAERRKRIEQAVSVVVGKMKPVSLCRCGKFCALDRKLRDAVK